MNTKGSKMNEPHNIVLNLLQVLHSGSLNKHVALQNTSIYYMWENIREQHKNNKLKIKIAI